MEMINYGVWSGLWRLMIYICRNECFSWIDGSMSGTFPVVVDCPVHKFNAENNCMCQNPFLFYVYDVTLLG